MHVATSHGELDAVDFNAVITARLCGLGKRAYDRLAFSAERAVNVCARHQVIARKQREPCVVNRVIGPLGQEKRNAANGFVFSGLTFPGYARFNATKNA